MMGKTHMLVGATAATSFLYFTTGTLEPVVIIAGALGGLLPDVDHPNSTISRKNALLSVASYLYRLLLKAFAFFINIPFKMLKNNGVKIGELSAGHRGPLTHGLLGVLLFAVVLFPVFLFNSSIYIGLLIGILSHILIDMLNPQGAPLLYPIYPKHMRFLPKFLAPTTGTAGETAIRTFIIVAAGYMGYEMFDFYNIDWSVIETILGDIL